MKRTAILVAVIVVLILVVAVAAVYSSGVFTKSNGGVSPLGGGGGQTYSAAVAIATPSASGVAGGPWTIVGAVGLLLGSPYPVNATVLNNSVNPSGCPITYLSGASSITSFPSSSGAPDSGTSNAWFLDYQNASGGILGVGVLGGTATPLIKQQGFTGCSSSIHETASLPATVVDSPVAAAAAMKVGGNSFAANHSKFNVDYILSPTQSSGGTGIPASWEIVLTNCNPGGTSSATLDGKSPSQFIGIINATSGQVTRAENVSTACFTAPSGGGGGGGKASFATAASYVEMNQENNSNLTSPVFWNNGSFYGSALNLTLSQFTATLENNSTGAPISTVGITLKLDFLNLTTGKASVASTYNFGTNVWTTPGLYYGTPLSPYFLVIRSTSTMAGDKIVFTATSTAPITGSIDVPLGGTYIHF